jgi:hypothetical protein
MAKKAARSDVVSAMDTALRLLLEPDEKVRERLLSARRGPDPSSPIHQILFVRLVTRPLAQLASKEVGLACTNSRLFVLRRASAALVFDVERTVPLTEVRVKRWPLFELNPHSLATTSYSRVWHRLTLELGGDVLRLWVHSDDSADAHDLALRVRDSA